MVEQGNKPIFKALGLLFNTEEDSIAYKIRKPENPKFTRRGMLSLTASVWDPIGVLLPVIMYLRMLMQAVWVTSTGNSWDEPINDALKAKFVKFLEKMDMLSAIKIPRWTGTFKNSLLEICGFCDASQDGYAAVLYGRTRLNNNELKISFLGARGRVTPVKNQRNNESQLCTIPKFELLGIVLLSQLYKETVKNFKHLHIRFFAYTDSEIALGWVRNDQQHENKFIRRKVASIRRVIQPAELNHVKGEENPADLPSRGILPEQLHNNTLWFFGPDWLKNDKLPFTPFTEKSTTALLLEEDLHFIHTFSSLTRLVRSVAYMMRWRTYKREKSTTLLTKEEAIVAAKANTHPLTADDVIKARRIVIRIDQNLNFSDEMNRLKRGKQIYKRTWVSSLTPFIDTDGIIRAGGRLSAASHMSEHHKHPILIGKGKLRDLIIRHTHITHGHCGNSLSERIIREDYWLPAIKQGIQKQKNSCLLCTRWKARATQPIMGDLPQERVVPAPCFQQTGVDLSGPWSIRASAIKFEKIIKVYIALFICLVTKAVHLEICSDLSTENFLAAVTRFTSRRGQVALYWSDNGGNFVGASRLMKESWEKVKKEGSAALATQEVQWKFNPPYTPSMGGLWESNIRVMKTFLRKMANTSNLHYEAFSTLLCRVEAFMNSRPMYPMNKDTDCPALTPFHFINQRGFKLSPIDATTVPATKRWLAVQKLQAELWSIFKTDYLNTLITRSKWRIETTPLKVDDVVLIKDEATVPGVWPLGRVTEIVEDKKGNVRSMKVKPAFKKEQLNVSAKRLVLLPLREEDDRPQRRSPRLLNKSTALITTALFCWLAGPMSEALVIQTLHPGVYVKNIGEVSQKTLDFEFTLQTDLNIADDRKRLDNHVSEFKIACNHYKRNNFSKLFNHCSKYVDSLDNEAQEVKLSISTVNTRIQRYAPASYLAKKIAMSALKASPTVALTGTVIYESYQTRKLKAELQALERRIAKVSAVAMNTTELEFHELDEHVDQMLAAQQQLKMEAQITDYAAGVSIIIEKILIRHQNAKNLRPVKELEQKLSAINQPDLYTLPPTDKKEDVFTFHKISKLIQNETVFVRYTIPLVKAERFQQFALISVPNVAGMVSFVVKNRSIAIVNVNAANTTFFTSETADEEFPNIFTNIRTSPVKICLKEVLSGAEPKYCVSRHQEPVEGVILLNPRLAVILPASANNLKLQMDCEDGREEIPTRAALVEFHDNCRLMQGNQTVSPFKITSHVLDATTGKDDDLTPPEIKEPESLTESPELQKMKKEWREQIGELDQSTNLGDSFQNSFTLLYLILGGFAVLFAVIVWALFRRRKRRWVKDWIGNVELATINRA